MGAFMSLGNFGCQATAGVSTGIDFLATLVDGSEAKSYQQRRDECEFQNWLFLGIIIALVVVAAIVILVIVLCVCCDPRARQSAVDTGSKAVGTVAAVRTGGKTVAKSAMRKKRYQLSDIQPVNADKKHMYAYSPTLREVIV